jgi:hypothetical protein
MGRCECSARAVEHAECQAKPRHPRCRNTRYGTASGRNDSTNKNLQGKNSEMLRRQLGDKSLASLVVLGLTQARRERERTRFQKGEDRQRTPGGVRERR